MQGVESGRGFWDLLARDEQRDLLAVARDKKYSPGAILCFQGDPATHVFVLLNGWVKVLAVTEDGHENVLALRGDGEVVGETTGEITAHRNATVQAIGTVHALIVGNDSFSAFLHSHPGADQAHRRMWGQRWNDADTMLRRHVVTSGAQRLAALLLDLAERHGSRAGNAIEVALPLSQEELASLVGASRATITRALGNWRERGFIRTGQHRIIILDLHRLRQVAGPASTGHQAMQLRPGGVQTRSERSPDVLGQVRPSPYKGLRAFEKEDKDLFFGRASVVEELVCAVAMHALVPVVGASGVGKSSVVHAGLVPRLEMETGWGFVTVRPRPTLLMALAAGLARLSGSDTPLPVGILERWR